MIAGTLAGYLPSLAKPFAARCGSVKPTNAAELLDQPDIDGFLVGGASLKADEFLRIVGC